jgi:hypothetical protein
MVLDAALLVAVAVGDADDLPQRQKVCRRRCRAHLLP